MSILITGALLLAALAAVGWLAYGPLDEPPLALKGTLDEWLALARDEQPDHPQR